VPRSEPDANPEKKSTQKPRSAALLATLITVPIALIVGLLVGLGVVSAHKNAAPTTSASSTATNAPLAAITVAAPPSNAATVAPCTKVLQELPVALGDLPSRVVHPQPDSPFVVAWGDPAVVLRCGVDRPAGLSVGSTAQTIVVDDVVFLVGDRGGDTTAPNVFTVVDREPYIEVTVPASYTQPPLGPIADAVAKALPKLCTVPADPVPGASTVPDSQLCTHRK
jgi:hypothetical protein